MEYREPLLAIVAVVAFIFWSFEFTRFGKRPQLHFYSKNPTQSSLQFFKFLLYVAGTISFVLLGFALMGPRRPQFIGQQEIEVNDIFMVADVSNSMLAEDFEPNRIEVAKDRIRDFLKMKPADRIGIVMFSERAYTILPLTQDLNLVDQAVDDIRVGVLGSGTNIGDALALAVAREVASEAKRKVIVILTDGVSNVGNMTPMDAAKQAKDNGIIIYSIGIGSDAQARMPIGPPDSIFGQRYQNLPGGSYDMKTLKDISELTNGKAFAAKNEKGLKAIFDEIQKLEKTKIKISGSVVFDELFFPYLLWGVILFLLVEMGRYYLLRENC